MAFGGLTSLLCVGDGATVLAGHLMATLYAWAPTAAAAVVVLMGAVHSALARCCRRYRDWSIDQQLVTCLHALMSLIFAIQIVPYTWVVCRLLFDQDFQGR